MINKFKLKSINDICKINKDDKLYTLSLKALTDDVHKFGIDFDGEDYNENCWIVEIHDKYVDIIEEIFYITFNGSKEKYCDISPKFREYIIEELKRLTIKKETDNYWDILSNDTLKGLIDLYEYEISYIEGKLLKLYDKQLDEYKAFFSKEELIHYFVSNCEYKYDIDNNEFYINQANILRNLIETKS